MFVSLNRGRIAIGRTDALTLLLPVAIAIANILYVRAAILQRGEAPPFEADKVGRLVSAPRAARGQAELSRCGSRLD